MSEVWPRQSIFINTVISWMHAHTTISKHQEAETCSYDYSKIRNIYSKEGFLFGIKLLFKIPFLPLDLILPIFQGLIFLLPPVILDLPTLTIFTYPTLPNRFMFISSAMSPSQPWPLHGPTFFLVVCRDLRR